MSKVEKCFDSRSGGAKEKPGSNAARSQDETTIRSSEMVHFIVHTAGLEMTICEFGLVDFIEGSAGLQGSTQGAGIVDVVQDDAGRRGKNEKVEFNDGSLRGVEQVGHQRVTTLLEVVLRC